MKKKKETYASYSLKEYKHILYASYSLKEYILYALCSLKGTMLGYQPSFCPHTRLPAFPLQSANWATSGGVRDHSLLFDSLHLKTEYQTRKTTHTHIHTHKKKKKKQETKENVHGGKSVNMSTLSRKPGSGK